MLDKNRDYLCSINTYHQNKLEHFHQPNQSSLLVFTNAVVYCIFSCFKYSFYIHNNDNDLIVANGSAGNGLSVILRC